MAPSQGNAAWPPLRGDLDIAPIEHEGRSMFLVQDGERLAEHALVVSPAGLAVASLFDGRRTAAEIEALIARESPGSKIPAADIDRIAEQLAQARLLETEEVVRERRQLLQDFQDSPARKSALPGSFPIEPLELASFLGGFFRDGKGPGEPLSGEPTSKEPPVGLVSPHIDLQRGGPAYAWAYGALAKSPPPDVVIALGVAHASPNSPWVMTRKEYETPYGPMKVDAELYDDLAKELWYDPRADEWAHRKEHSLEFQALWLRFLWREKTPPWVPILTSTFERFASDRAPSTIETVEKAIQAIASKLTRRGKTRRIMILAGVDLAHVGPRFGDELELTPELEKKIEAEDRLSLEHALKLDADPFYLSVVKDGHWRKVCGLSALYTSLRWIKALGGSSASLLTYGQAPDPLGGIVSFTSAIFPRA